MASMFTAAARNANNANPAKAVSPDSSALSFGSQRPPVVALVYSLLFRVVPVI